MPGINRLQWPLCYLCKKSGTPGRSRTRVILRSKRSTISVRRRGREENGALGRNQTPGLVVRTDSLYSLSYEGMRCRVKDCETKPR